MSSFTLFLFLMFFDFSQHITLPANVEVIWTHLDYLRCYTLYDKSLFNSLYNDLMLRALSDNDRMIYRGSLDIDCSIVGKSTMIFLVSTTYLDHTIPLCRIKVTNSKNNDMYMLTIDIYGKWIIVIKNDTTIRSQLLSFFSSITSPFKLTRLDYNIDTIGCPFPLKREKIKISKNASHSYITREFYKKNILETQYIWRPGESAIAYRWYRKDIEMTAHNTWWLYYPQYTNEIVQPHIIRHEFQLSDKYLFDYLPLSISSIFDEYIQSDNIKNWAIKRSWRTRRIAQSIEQCKYRYNEILRLWSKSEQVEIYDYIMNKPPLL